MGFFLIFFSHLADLLCHQASCGGSLCSLSTMLHHTQVFLGTFAAFMLLSSFRCWTICLLPVLYSGISYITLLFLCSEKYAFMMLVVKSSCSAKCAQKYALSTLWTLSSVIIHFEYNTGYFFFFFHFYQQVTFLFKDTTHISKYLFVIGTPQL